MATRGLIVELSGMFLKRKIIIINNNKKNNNKIEKQTTIFSVSFFFL